MATDAAAGRPPRPAGQSAKTAIRAASQASHAFGQQDHASPTKYDWKYKSEKCLRANSANCSSDIDELLQSREPFNHLASIHPGSPSDGGSDNNDNDNESSDQEVTDLECDDENDISSDSDPSNNPQDKALDAKELGSLAASAETQFDLVSGDQEPVEPARNELQPKFVAYPSEPDSSSRLNCLPVSVRLMIIDHLDSSPFAIFSLMSTSKLWYTTLAHTIGAEAGWYRRCRMLGAKVHSPGCKTWHATYLKRLHKKCLSCLQTTTAQYGIIWPGAPNWVVICRFCQATVPSFRCLTRTDALRLNIPPARLDMLPYKLHQLRRRMYVQEYRERTVKAWQTLKVRSILPYMNRAMQRAIDGYLGNKHLLKQVFDTAFNHPISVLLRDSVERLLAMQTIPEDAYSECLKLYLMLREAEAAAQEAIKLKGIQVCYNDLQLCDMALYDESSAPFTWLDCIYSMRNNALDDYIASLTATRERGRVAHALSSKLVKELDSSSVKAEKRQAKSAAKAKTTLPAKRVSEQESPPPPAQPPAKESKKAEKAVKDTKLSCLHVDGCHLNSTVNCTYQRCRNHCHNLGRCQCHSSTKRAQSEKEQRKTMKDRARKAKNKAQKLVKSALKASTKRSSARPPQVKGASRFQQPSASTTLSGSTSAAIRSSQVKHGMMTSDLANEAIQKKVKIEPTLLTRPVRIVVAFHTDEKEKYPTLGKRLLSSQFGSSIEKKVKTEENAS